MTNTLNRQLFFILGLSLVCFQVKAATATATVSAKIVPNTSLFMSSNIILSKKFDNYQGKEQTRVDGVSIETSTFNTKNSAKIKINASHNAAYDISISPSTVITDMSSNKVKIETLRTLNNFKSLNNNKEQELVIEAVVSDEDLQDAGYYIGTVEIIVNYN